MGRPERPVDPDAGPLQHFAYELRKLRQQAGGISYRQLARQAHYSATTLSEAASGETLPSLAVTLAYVEACRGNREVWEARWRAVAAQLGSAGDETETIDTKAPYLGLATFQPEDASRYFGREQLIDELLTRLAASRFLAVFGASGSGKSSLLRAGLLPAVWAGRLPDSQEWKTVLFTPGRHPLEETAIHVAALRAISPGSLHADLVADPLSLDLAIRQALVARSPEAQVLLLVDQFEEVFTLCADEQERAAFIAALLGSVAESGRTRLVLGVRADFYGRCADYPAFVAALRDAQLLIGPMDADELRDVIVKPAAAEGMRVEAALVATVLADVTGRPGALPLLSHALLETWRHRKSTTMTLAGYHAIGGIQRAVGRTAEQVFGQLSPEQQVIAKNVFLRLTALGEGTEDTSRRANRSELRTADPAPVQRVLDRLTQARLITLGADSVEIAHEALIREWPRLRQWLTDDRDVLRMHRRLTEAAIEWADNDREEGFLYRGTRLAAWADRPLERLSELERDFLETSRQRAVREHSVARRRVRVGVSVLAVASTVISVLAVTTVVQRNDAREQRDLALARQIATSAAAQLPIDPELSLLLARRAYAIQPIAEAETALRQATAESRVQRTLNGHDGPVNDLTYSPDGRRIASAGEDGVVRLWTTDDAHTLRHDAPVRDVAFSSDGRRLATGSDDGTVRVWDAASETVLAVLRGHEDRVNSVALSSDGLRVVSGGDDGTVRIWDVARRIPLAVLGDRSHPVSSVAFAPRDHWVAAAGGPWVATTDAFTLQVWDWSAGQMVLHRDHENPVEGVSFSPDGQRVATASTDGIVRVWTTTGGGDPLLLRGHLRVLGDIAFSNDGRQLVVNHCVWHE